MSVIDLTGQTFGRLTVVAFSHVAVEAFWVCRCTCGATKTVRGSALRRGNTRSCGCFRRAVATTHGHAPTGRPTGTYRSWAMLIQRCTNPNNPDYPDYGGRGITVCERWRTSFEAFLADMGERAKGMSIDRIDVNGHYEPGNCRWADAATQAANKRRYKLRTHCRHGHEWTPENTRVSKKHGWRECRACDREVATRRRQARASGG